MAMTNKRTAGVVASVAALAMAAVGLQQYEGDRLVPYRDTGGIWTVCRGITGPAVIPGKKYTPAECEGLNALALKEHDAAIAQCITAPLTDKQRAAWLMFAYNVGPKAFCTSTAARMINAGRQREACAQISRFHYVAGKDCNIRANNCAGIIERRRFERSLCEGAA